VDIAYREQFLVNHFAAFASALLTVPGHPEHGPFFLLKGLINSVQSYRWYGLVSARAAVCAYAAAHRRGASSWRRTLAAGTPTARARWSSTCTSWPCSPACGSAPRSTPSRTVRRGWPRQRRACYGPWHPHVSRPLATARRRPVETNAELFGGDDRYYAELDMIASTLLGEIIKFLQSGEGDSLVRHARPLGRARGGARHANVCARARNARRPARSRRSGARTSRWSCSTASLRSATLARRRPASSPAPC